MISDHLPVKIQKAEDFLWSAEKILNGVRQVRRKHAVEVAESCYVFSIYLLGLSFFFYLLHLTQFIHAHDGKVRSYLLFISPGWLAYM